VIQRVPPGIYSTAQLEKWLREASRQDPKVLHMRMADLMRHDAAAVTAEAFPDALAVGATRLPLEYHFDPGSAADGLTLVGWADTQHLDNNAVRDETHS
jgi:ATP-dependent helicase HrpA